MKHESLLGVEWSAPTNVQAFTTMRRGGVSSGPWASFNLAAHVEDDPCRVAVNRRLLMERLALPACPAWLEQVHGSRIVDLDGPSPDFRADGSITRAAGMVCAVLTADCLPVLLCNRAGTAVAALHAGWRGLAAGILEQGVRRMPDDSEVLAWLGPAIGPGRFEVGGDVVEQLGCDAVSADGWCRGTDKVGKYLVDIYQLARQRLSAAGVAEVSGGGWCTFSDEARFFSYRRQGRCGRMASLVWLADPRASSE